MKETFSDTTLQKQFEEQGYVVVKCPYNFNFEEIKNDVNYFKPSDNYKGNQDTKIGRQSFHITFFDNDVLYKQQMYNYVQKLFFEFAKKTFVNHKCCQANVFLKLPNSGYVYPHQNLTIVNENEYTSVSCWMPLQDTNSENGTICLIPKSHHYFQKYRNTTIYWPYVDFFKNGIGLNNFTPINVKQGEVLFMDDRIVHYTPINKSNHERWVLHSLWTPLNAQLKFFDIKLNEVGEYNVTDDYWQYSQPGHFPDKKDLHQTIKYIDNNYTEEDLITLLNILKV